MQEFSYLSGVHDVWSVPDATCDFEASGAEEVGALANSVYSQKLDAPGTYYFACSTVGHCEAGQLLEVNVQGREGEGGGGGGGGGNSGVDGAVGGGGLCSAAVPVENSVDGAVVVTCRSEAIRLSPGDNVYPTIPLPSPYPEDTTVVILSVAAEVVDADGRPVPLSEVYLHHTFGDYRFIPGEGAETRQSPMRNPLAAPYGMVLDGSEFTDDESRLTNVHVINTVGVAPEDVKSCIECWCDSDDGEVIGSIGCCRKCPSSSTAAPKDYFLEYVVTYRELKDESSVEPVVHVALDINGAVEYSVQQGEPGSEDVVDKTFAFDHFCPQDKEFAILRCWAHQHIGGRCVTLSNPENGGIICKSCPVYGTEEGVLGNEKGYLVGMTGDLLPEPYVLQPGQKVRFQSVYDASEPYGGVMSIATVGLIGFDVKEECDIDFGGFIQVR